MASLTKHIKASKQPADGYIPVSAFTYKKHNSYTVADLYKNENIILPAVQYILQMYISENVDKNLLMIETALRNAPFTNKNELIKQFYNGIASKNPIASAEYAVKLANIEVMFRLVTLPDKAEPDIQILESVSLMSERCKDFFGRSVKLCGFDFEGGYSERITSGNGGYLTNDTLWIITVSDSVTSYDTLLVSVQYIMGLHSYISPYFKKLKRLGIYNPRLDAEYTLNICDIPKKVIQEISKHIIQYS